MLWYFLLLFLSLLVRFILVSILQLQSSNLLLSTLMADLGNMRDVPTELAT